MILRCDLHLNGGHRKLILSPHADETLDHLALKLSAFLLLWAEEPLVAPSAKHPALLGQEFRPDLLALDDRGEARLWIECGTVSMNKLSKVSRRFPYAQLIVVKESPEDGRRLRRDLEAESLRRAPAIWAWPKEAFRDWRNALGERTEAFGESGDRSLNLVINETPIAVDFQVVE
ncbi:MAG: YaeQ family protein [Elusimicrobia bacterium]|nr:YaeQ family protein [Elusimicrobiota bacterium]